MVNDKIISYRVEPYIQEAMLQILIDVIILVGCLAVAAIFKSPNVIIVMFALWGIYFGFALIFYYFRWVFRVITDKCKKDYVTEIINTNSIRMFSEDVLFSGNHFRRSNVRLFYPKGMHVDRYKIKAVNDKGEKIKLRTVTTFGRIFDFMILEKDMKIEQLQVTYLRRSKILLNVSLVDDINKIKSKKKRTVIEKSLRSLNNPI